MPRIIASSVTMILTNDEIHYCDVIMGTMASHITSLTIVYSAVYSGADQRKHQSFTSLAFVRGIHRGPVNSLHKWLVKREMFPSDDVIMITLLFFSFRMCDAMWNFSTREWSKMRFLFKIKRNRIFDHSPKTNQYIMDQAVGQIFIQSQAQIIIPANAEFLLSVLWSILHYGLPRRWMRKNSREVNLPINAHTLANRSVCRIKISYTDIAFLLGCHFYQQLYFN